MTFYQQLQTYNQGEYHDRVCICIPARYNSSRLPGKLMFQLGKETCIQRTINSILPLGLKVFVLTDHHVIAHHLKQVFKNNIKIITTDTPCKNGTERISKYLYEIPKQYDIIVNIQADEPFINPTNVKHAIWKHFNVIQTCKDEKLFYTTLHEQMRANTPETKKYLNSTSSLTVTTTNSGKVLTYTRNIIPWNKKGSIDSTIQYKLFTGIYVFNRKMLDGFYKLPDTEQQLLEDIEQMKVLEHDYNIYSFPTIQPNEISLNDKEDLHFLCAKYNLQCVFHEI